MRKFSSYGPINTKTEYYVQRQGLIDTGCSYLVGDNPQDGGYYFTVWAPRQSGKTWVMQQVMLQLRQTDDFEVGICNLQSARYQEEKSEVLRIFRQSLCDGFRRDFPAISDWSEIPSLFTKKYFSKPVILILDEFDALKEQFINRCVNEFRTLYVNRKNESELPTGDKKYLLHGLALIGVRSVLGVDSDSGSPFNTQQSLSIPNLTEDEVNLMFQWCQQESGQPIEQEVVDTIFYETRGQPGLVSWFGELLTERYNQEREKPITSHHLDKMLLWATDGLGNNNIANIISKADQEPYNQRVLELFDTDNKTEFKFDDPQTNFLYLNGIIDIDDSGDGLYARFSSPFVQKRLFNRYSYQLFGREDRLYGPFDELADVVTPNGLDIPNLMQRYERYVQENREQLFKNAPRRKNDLRIYEAVYHFHLFAYLERFFKPFPCKVWPEFPTGNGKVDLFIDFDGQVYALEVKSFSTQWEYKSALTQAAQYGHEMKLSEISLVFFIDDIDETNREKFQASHVDAKTSVTVSPVFVQLG